MVSKIVFKVQGNDKTHFNIAVTSGEAKNGIWEITQAALGVVIIKVEGGSQIFALLLL